MPGRPSSDVGAGSHSQNRVSVAVGIDPAIEFSSRYGMRMDAPRTPAQAVAVGTPVRLFPNGVPLVREVL